MEKKSHELNDHLVRLVKLKEMVDKSYKFGLISKKTWREHREMIREIYSIRLDYFKHKIEANGNKTSS